MPSDTTEFRVGDRVETRRGENIPEEFRRLRAEVTAVMESGQIQVRFANPPINGGGPWNHHPTGRFWEPEELRLVERTLRLEPGARVMISNPAFTRPDGTGMVDTPYYGQEGVVTAPSYMDHCWMVAVAGREEHGTNHIHRNYLTVIEEAPPSRFEQRDLVEIADPCYSTSHPDSLMGHLPLGGRVGILMRPDGPGRWRIRPVVGGSAYTIHENWLTPHVDDAEPRLSVGQMVRVEQGYGVAGGREPHPGWSGATGVVMGIEERSPTRVRVGRIEHPGDSAVLHQDCLTPVDLDVPAPGTTVRMPGWAGRCHGGEFAPIPSRYAERIGTVGTDADREGNVRVDFRDGRQCRVHPGFLRTYTAEEAAAMYEVGERVRVSLDAHVYADGSGVVDESLLGRIVTCSSEYSDLNSWYVIEEHTGAAGTVANRYLTRLNPVSTVESGFQQCRDCGEAVPDDEAVVIAERHYCPSCVATCIHCGLGCRINHRSQTVVRTTAGWECLDCTARCSSCAIRQRTTMMLHTGGSRWWCSAHHRTCADAECSSVAVGMERFCRECREDEGTGGLGRWRHTTPTVWIGGPVRKQGGYYIGFEHEISASGSFRLRPLRRWSAAHLKTEQGLDLKPDSSVRGFEIATQPMTPAFFEEVDWDSYMEVLNREYPCSEEPEGHGLHVHIGRQAFRTEKTQRRDSRGRRLRQPKKVMVTDSGMLAAFTYLLSRGHSHLTRIGRRDSSWAVRNDTPVKSAIVHQFSELTTTQKQKLAYAGARAGGRGAVNLNNPNTIEIRVARSTRSAAELKAAVRVVYLAAEYVRHLRRKGAISPKDVTWPLFARWVGEVMPEAHASIAGPGAVATAVTAMSPTLMEAFSTPASIAARESGSVNVVCEEEVPVLVGEAFRVTPMDSFSWVESVPTRPAVFAVGTRVRVSNPAYTSAAEPEFEGDEAVDPDFYGAVCVVEGHSGDLCVVRDRGVGYTNVIHPNWLTEVTPGDLSF